MVCFLNWIKFLIRLTNRSLIIKYIKANIALKIWKKRKNFVSTKISKIKLVLNWWFVRGFDSKKLINLLQIVKGQPKITNFKKIWRLK